MSLDVSLLQIMKHRNVPSHVEVLASRLICRTVVDGSGCWKFTGCHHDLGYGVMGAAVAGKKYTMMTHRIMCMYVYGPPTGKQDAMHSCDKCHNPEHLSWGSRQKNMQQARDRLPGKHQRLTLQQVEYIRHSQDTHASLARRLGVGESTVSDIRNGRTWRPEVCH